MRDTPYDTASHTMRDERRSVAAYRATERRETRETGVARETGKTRMASTREMREVREVRSAPARETTARQGLEYLSGPVGSANRRWNRTRRRWAMNRPTVVIAVACVAIALLAVVVLVFIPRLMPQMSSFFAENSWSGGASSPSIPYASEQGDDDVFSDDALPEVLLVNKDHPLPNSYVAPRTTALAGRLPVMYDTLEVADEVVGPLLALSAAAQDAGHGELLVVSAYRTRQEQTALYENADDKSFVQSPGASEHETGFAVDLAAQGSAMESIENTAAGQWLMENAHRYGFILRYPADKVNFTGISYEPWHYRYVGVGVATYCYNNNLCLEEYAERAAGGA